MQETQVRSLGQEDPLEEGTATHSSVLAWRIPWTEEPGGHSPWGHKRIRHNLGLSSNNKLYLINRVAEISSSVSSVSAVSGVLGKPNGLYVVYVFPGSELVLIQGKGK